MEASLTRLFQLLNEEQGHFLNCISFDDRFIVTSSDDNSFILWNIQQAIVRQRQNEEEQSSSDNAEKAIRTFRGHTDCVREVAFTKDKKRIVSASDDTTLRLWCVNSGRTIRVFRGHSDWVLCLSVSNDNKYIVSGSQDGTAILWNLETGNKLKVYNDVHSKAAVSSVAISSENEFVVLASYDEEAVEIWNSKNSHVTHTFTGHTKTVTSISLSSDDRYIYTRFDDGTIRMLDLSNVPNIPGTAWKILKPFIMTRGLVIMNNARRKETFSSSAEGGQNNNNNKVASLSSSFFPITEEGDILQTFLLIESDDLFRHIISLLVF